MEEKEIKDEKIKELEQSNQGYLSEIVKLKSRVMVINEIMSSYSLSETQKIETVKNISQLY